MQPRSPLQALEAVDAAPPHPTSPAPNPALPPAAAPAASVNGAWRLALAAWVQSRKRYPDAARRDGVEGQVSVRFTVGRDGQVLDAAIVRGSGSDALDAAALAMFRGARAPAFPPDMTQPGVTTTVSIHYRLEE